MTMSNIIGIDIGATGALALVSPDGELLEVEDMPILRDGPAGRPNVNAPLLSAIVSRWEPGRPTWNSSARGPRKALQGLSRSGGPEASLKASAPPMGFLWRF